MSTGALIFTLILAVASSQATANCFKKYLYCAIPVINNQGSTENCSVAVPLINCLTDATKECLPDYVTYMENYRSLVIDICDPNSPKKEEWKKLGECGTKNAVGFRKCKENLPDNECKALGDSIACLTSMTKDLCGEFAGDVLTKVMLPFAKLAETCEKSALVQDCLLNNTETLRTCKLQQKEFNSLGDICSSVEGFTECFANTSKEVCGPEAEELVRFMTDDIVFATDICMKLDFISGITISQCDREILKCHVDVLNIGEFQCKDASDYVGCMHEAVKICEDDEKTFYLLVLEKYKSKFPDYCNAESTFNKNLKEKFDCINSTFGSVMGPCYDKLEKDKQEIKEDDKVGNMRVYMNFLDCLSKEFGKGCGKEAESAVYDLLSPLGQSMDETCRLITGKGCNGAAGLMVATWLLIASLVFLLKEENE